MKLYVNPNEREIIEICKRPQENPASLRETVTVILNEVRQRGDEALRRYTKKFDNIELDSLKLDVSRLLPQQRNKALDEAISTAIENITKFHSLQLRPDYSVETTDGVICERLIVPIEKAGLYVPGGSTSLFSSLIMQCVPARLAGVKEIVVCVSPCSQTLISAETAQAATLLGLKALYPVGGAQAIGAMAFGTQTIPKVDKIFGPGNQYVTEAKKLVQELGTPIDLPAGPSELAVICDETCDPEFVAWDLLSQAEHGKDSQVLLISWDERTVYAVLEKISKLLPSLPRSKEAKESIQKSSAVIVRNIEEAARISNEYAPEHLSLFCQDSNYVLKKIANAGSVFIGPYAPEALGDYASGTNHVLPTGGYARTLGGLSVESFQKTITVQRVSPDGLRSLGPKVQILAEAEGLFAHAQAVKARLLKLECEYA